jgi:Holliday junction resolvasome RuvABC DNA-binding subunit
VTGTAERTAAELSGRLAAAEADREAAQARAAQLAEQVSNLAAALANLGARHEPASP